MNEFQKHLDEKLAKATVAPPPKTFTVYIEETISDKFTVEADTMEEAMQIAEQKYYNGEFVVMPQAPNVKQMMADDGEETTEWVEF